MHACTISDRPLKKSDCTAVVVGHGAVAAPTAVERLAARIAKGELKGPVTVAVDGRSWILVKLPTDAWLVGGEDWRVVGAQIVAEVRKQALKTCTIAIGGRQARIRPLVEGLVLGDYVFDLLRSGEAAKRPRLSIHLPGPGAEIAQGLANAEAQNLARELADLPGNLLNPSTFIARIRRELRGSGLRVSVTQGTERLRRAGFPGLAQVGQAGSAPPALVEIRYLPKTMKKSEQRHLALVGKGLTFDSGGLSLKPAADMWEMKADMSGAAAVLAAMKQIARQGAAVPVSGYLALAENLPDARAQRPGDIYKARNGKSIHVDNTDAEGRLVLADVLTYAGERGATHLLDVATLTGAALVATGTNIAPVMGSHEKWVARVREAGQAVGEEFWPLPLYGEYRQLLDHPHADLNNIGGRNGGSILGGLFLAEFVAKDVKWAHLDIAGPAIQTKGWRYFAKGMTGFGVRTLVELAASF